MATFHAAIRHVSRAIGRAQATADRLARRVLLLIGRGRISAPVNDAGPVQLLQAQINELETIDNLRRIAEFGFTSVPPQGSDVAIVFVGGDRGSGLVIGTNHQASRPTGLNPGETMIFTQDGKQIYLTAGGGIIVKANGQPVEVNDATTVTIVASTEIVADTPILKCTGDILDNCNTNSRTVAGMRSVANGHTHPVPNVQLGGPGTTTQPPNQPE
ncbi:phage baseplate assembly protein V [Paraburkholderia sp. BL23I1N1]|uniref:phage baseplate assembly protein V n=1 Tax=Paraburkholderia sp. BL23I1N1 TaxID=1938802 RepID=UPI000E72924F|nr:phage baseplate assembly protein V [Paraburkholderia sp. BL23I1N1]RKE35300.1 phage baseplate assembly protein V [Paraburkholderia sp. BL23I1N1]